MMLELLLTRSEDRELVRAAQGLRFLVFDELHTYRGRQGADVALLIRRCRQAFGGHDIICVGTSATMASGGSIEDQKREVAKVAKTLFGVPFDASQVIGETLERATPEADFADPAGGPVAARGHRIGRAAARRLRALPRFTRWPPGSSPPSVCAPRQEQAASSGRRRGSLQGEDSAAEELAAPDRHRSADAVRRCCADSC